MAGKSDDSSKDASGGEREQFDSFDRLQKVDQKNLNVDKLKATDKDSDSEELLATKERTNFSSIKEESGTVKFTNTNFQLDNNYKIEQTEIDPLEDSIKSSSSQNVKTASSSSGNSLLDFEFKTAANLQIDSQTSNIEYVGAKISNASENQQEQGPLPLLGEGGAANTVATAKPAAVVSTREVSSKESVANSDNNSQVIEDEKPLIPPVSPEVPPVPSDNSNSNDQFLIQLPNGNYKLVPGQGFSLTLDSISSDTIYDNTFGHYFADINGNPISGSIDFTNVKQSLEVGDAITINYGSGDIPPGAVTLGFFIIPNGDALNLLLPEGANITFSLNAEGHWIAIYNGRPINGEGAPIYFSDPSLNSDDQFQHSQINDGQISFKDSFGGIGSDGYNDVVINTKATLYTGPNTGAGSSDTGTGGDDGGTGTGGDDGGTGTGGDDGGTGTGGDDGGTGTGGDDGGNDNPTSIPVLLPNGNYNLVPGAGFSLTVDSIDSDAGYNSSFGHYFADINGNPISGSIDFTNVKESLGAGETITINYGPGDIPPGAVTVGFFIIPNGDSLNPLLPEGAKVTFLLNDQGQWTGYYNGNLVNGEEAPAYFSDPNLNPDGGATHSSNNEGQISFEDLFGGSSDGDYNDVVVNVQFSSYTGPDVGNVGNNNNDGGTGTGGDDGGTGTDHDNGHGNDDNGNDDSNPGNNGRNNSGGNKGGRNNRANEDNSDGNDKRNLNNSENIKDTDNDKGNNSKGFDNHDNLNESSSGKDDTNTHTVNDHHHQPDTNISAMNSNSWTDVVSNDSHITTPPSAPNWLEQVYIKPEADVTVHNDKDQEKNNDEDSSREVSDDNLNNDDKHSSNHHHF